MLCNKKYFLKNNELLNSEEFNIHDLENGIAIYEVVKIINAKALFLEEHIERMRKSAEIKGLKIWLTDKEIKEQINKICVADEVISGRLKFVFRFHEHENMFLAFFINMINVEPESYQTGVDIITINITRNQPQAKIINYELRQFVKQEVIKNKAFEALLINNKNNITEGSKSNFFVIKDKIVYTPPSHDVLEGITRKHVFEICKKNNIKIVEKCISFNDINNYDCCFITGTSLGVLPVRKIDNHVFKRNNGLLDLISSKYQQSIDEYI